MNPIVNKIILQHIEVELLVIIFLFFAWTDLRSNLMSELIQSFDAVNDLHDIYFQ